MNAKPKRDAWLPALASSRNREPLVVTAFMRSMGSAGMAPMNRGTTNRRRAGFTLVELLTVIMIIGILVALVTAAAWRARATARRATVVGEVSDISQALEAYASEVGELPPDFLGVNDSNATVRTAARQRVLSHLRRRFPRYRLPAGDVDTQWNQFRQDVLAGTDGGSGGLDVNGLDPTTALVFWLEGIPDPSRGDTLPKGFCADVYHPFQQGGSRTKQYFKECDPKRLADRGAGYCRQYYPQYCLQVPYVYFRARINPSTRQWGYTDVNNNPLFFDTQTSAGVAVPYLDADGTTWREADKFQIIAAGSDGIFGTGTGPRCSRSGVGFDPPYNDYDNITNFSKGTLQEEM